MVIDLIKQNRNALAAAYALTIGGLFAAQLYPLATGFAINGVLVGNYSAILWLLLCHFAMVTLSDISRRLKG